MNQKLAKVGELYIEHPNQNRIRRFYDDAGNELDIHVSVSAQNADDLGYSRIELERLATKLLRDHLSSD